MTSTLTNTLNRIETWINRHFPDETQYFQKGLSKEEIDDIAQIFPYSLPQEVYELYQWKNGTARGDKWLEQAFIFQGIAFFFLWRRSQKNIYNIS